MSLLKINTSDCFFVATKALTEPSTERTKACIKLRSSINLKATFLMVSSSLLITEYSNIAVKLTFA